MSRASQQEIVAWIGGLLLCAATLWRFGDAGASPLAVPRTVVDHVAGKEHETREVILLLPLVEPLIPRGANVTVFRPVNGRAHNDHGRYLAAVGLLPHHNVLPPFTAAHETQQKDLAEWVIAVEETFDHPQYAVVAGYPNGWLYKVRQ